MKSFSKLSLLASLVLASAVATAGGTGGLGHDGPGGGGGGGGGGSAAAVAAARAQAAANARVRNTVGITTTVGLGVNNVLGGATGGNATGNGFGGNATIGAGAVTVAGSTYQAAAAPSFAPGAHGPVKGCRLFAGLGGASVNGSGSAGLPIGNDQYCVTDNAHELMNRANARRPGTFTDDDYLRPVCLTEGMDKTAACKALEGRETAASGRSTAGATASLSGLGYTSN